MQPDLNQMLQNVQKMQEAMEKLQDELAQTSVQGSAGGGSVVISCTGSLDFVDVRIKPEAIDLAEISTLEDLVLAAIRDACDKARQLGEQKMSQSMSEIQQSPDALQGGLQLPPDLTF